MSLPISVIIPTMNRPESLERTLREIANGCEVPNQLIVVDQSNKSDLRICNERTVYSFREAFSNIDYITQVTPSLTKARNLGISLATNDIVVMSDDDVDVNIDTFVNLKKLFDNSQIAMVAAIDELSQKSKTNIGYLLGTKSLINRKIGHVTNSMLSRYPDHIAKQTETQWAQGYFFAIKKSLVDKWGLSWDENLTSYAYAEDMDFSFSYYKHAKVENYICVLDPSVKVKHLASLEYREPNDKSTFMYFVNREYLRHKHHIGFKGFIACNWCEFWILLSDLITGKNFRVSWRALLCKFTNAKDIRAGRLDYDKFMNR